MITTSTINSSVGTFTITDDTSTGIVSCFGPSSFSATFPYSVYPLIPILRPGATIPVIPDPEAFVKQQLEETARASAMASCMASINVGNIGTGGGTAGVGGGTGGTTYNEVMTVTPNPGTVDQLITLYITGGKPGDTYSWITFDNLIFHAGTLDSTGADSSTFIVTSAMMTGSSSRSINVNITFAQTGHTKSFSISTNV